MGRDHSRCNRIRMCLFEVGLDPKRMVCSDDEDGIFCLVNSGVGDEGFTEQAVDRLTDKALALAGLSGTDACHAHEWLIPRPPDRPYCKRCGALTDGAGDGR